MSTSTDVALMSIAVTRTASPDLSVESQAELKTPVSPSSPSSPAVATATAVASTTGGDDMEEYLLKPSMARYVLKPKRDEAIWKMYQKHQAAFWVVGEVDVKDDAKNYALLDKNEQHFIKKVLSFFAGSDGIVAENLAQRFYNDVQLPEARCFYGFQLAMENIHSEMYSLLLDEYIKDPTEKDELFDAIERDPAIARKAEWAIQWTSGGASFAERLVAFAVVEGIFFSGSFCAIFWLKHRGINLPGLITSNQFISRDEGLHCDFACLLYSKLAKKLGYARVLEILTSAVEIEKNFIEDSIKVSLIGMNATLMGQYIEFCADRLLDALGYPKHYHVENPFEWMDLISLEGKVNFFERRNPDYKKTGVVVDDDASSSSSSSSASHTAGLVGGATVDSSNHDFAPDDDF